jgi:hypothetical protein
MGQQERLPTFSATHSVGVIACATRKNRVRGLGLGKGGFFGARGALRFGEKEKVRLRSDGNVQKRVAVGGSCLFFTAVFFGDFLTL